MGSTGGSPRLTNNTEWQSSMGPVLVVLLARLLATPSVALKGDKPGPLFHRFPYKANREAKAARSGVRDQWMCYISCLLAGHLEAVGGEALGLAARLPWPCFWLTGVGIEREQNLPPKKYAL